MSQAEDSAAGDSSGEFSCSACGREAKDDFDFCPYCGAVFSEGVMCDKHPKAEAAGVCIVCGTPCCEDCGAMVDDMFLCDHHSSYEIYEGMVKVFGTKVEADAELAKSRLDEAGLHPALFHLRRSMDGGHVEYELYADAESFNASEIKVMVPCAEVAGAENVLKTPANS